MFSKLFILLLTFFFSFLVSYNITLKHFLMLLLKRFVKLLILICKVVKNLLTNVNIFTTSITYIFTMVFT
jgi:hypothetical protein